MEYSTQSSGFEAIEGDLQRQFCHAQVECKNCVEGDDESRSESAPQRHRLQDRESFLACEGRKREYQHHQEVTVMQKNLETASEQSQDNLQKIKTLSERKSMLPKELTELGKLPQSMKDLKASEQFEEIRELETNNIAFAWVTQQNGKIAR